MVGPGPSSAGPPPEWAVAPEGERALEPDRQEQPAWQGDVGDGVEAWLRAVAAGEITASPDAEPPGGTERHRGAGRPRGTKRSRRAGQSNGQEQTASGLAPDDDGSGDEADHEAVARKILLDQLTGQARSRKELADRLAKKNVPDEIAGALLDRFEEVGLIDDEAFARSWIASRQPGKGLARRALAQELRRKGIDDLVAREALDEIDPDDEDDAARRLVRKKLRTMQGLDRVKATRRLVGMLARKGYPPGMAFSVVRDELAAADQVDVDDDDPVGETPRDW
ncbi:regulatory protein RecX [Nocardioides sp. Soil796]|uniref:regulatory protein RecX n=1 Tax=Nocardioides sp. Soil796 TaxID=1736412 RepID=UPI0009ECB1A9|nr:regulatory protein RecX [Nocardioides sp. Soil796]